MIELAAIPSPTQGVWQLGFIPIRAYALCILTGIVVAVWVGERRYRARGGRAGTVIDISAWAVPFGVIGGRLYHVISSPQAYFGAGGRPLEAFALWRGGLGIWGAIALGGIGAWIGCRRAGVLLPPLADAVAPGIALAQAIGRWGNWFNNELYGDRTGLPWGLTIHQWDENTGRAVTDAAGHPVVIGTFQPTFLYESLWDLGTAGVLIWADRRFRMGHGRVFALYVVVYTLGRGWIEDLRIDPANHFLGLRLNEWTSLLVFLGGLTFLILSARRHPGRETDLLRHPTPSPAAGTPVDGAPHDAEADSDRAAEAASPGGRDGPDDSERDGPDGRTETAAPGVGARTAEGRPDDP